METRTCRPYESVPALDKVGVDGKMTDICNQLRDSLNRLVEICTRSTGENLSTLGSLLAPLQDAISQASELQWTIHISHGNH